MERTIRRKYCDGRLGVVRKLRQAIRKFRGNFKFSCMKKLKFVC